MRMCHLKYLKHVYKKLIRQVCSAAFGPLAVPCPVVAGGVIVGMHELIQARD